MRKLFKNSFFILMLLAVFSFLFMSNCSKEEMGKKPLRIAISDWAGYGIAYIAKDKGFFEKYGVNVELVRFKNISESLESYRKGQVDGFFSTLPDVIFLNSYDLPTKS